MIDDSHETIDRAIETLSRELPPVFCRKDVPKLLGNIIAAGTLANIDSRKQGPPRIKLKRNTAYERTSFLIWLKSYMVQQHTGVRS
ncbi:hypothetical protein Dde_3403 [Oleidesulfovibrio alaskensis G20]|jgi:hypothetical protein|uniref:Uncharacterized protein n=1 Tax=Oleidesulfovibrio alaskensis (strain ATCC BAA-1058 / DSM 17464 / G20) TaxID=207559 RepID=Q30VU9_OLEA2|nr:hypothetical protein [Oleidesulfovibrio alaskensis]ABB40197.1 hypothetical protein Dde_3403 [Oleidesulfovibrio alaskensis G20]